MWKGAGIFRTASELKATLGIIAKLSGSALQAKSNRNLAECCTVQNMLLTASLVCRAALLRPESRGAHVRKDVTQAWDAQGSPYSHTFLSQKREGIEKKEGAP